MVLVMVSVLLGVIGEVMIHVVGVECGWVGRGQEMGMSYIAQFHTHHN